MMFYGLSNTKQYPPLWRIVVFVIMMSVYAFWSSSTPDSLGLPEALFGALLLLFVGLRGAMITLGGFLLQSSLGMSKLVFVSFLGLLIFPLVWGLAVRQNPLNDIMRDFIPLLYLFLPVFFIPVMSKYPAFWKKMCLGAICIIGISYSLRHFLGSHDQIENFGQEVFFTDKNYFPMDPAVLFCATFLLIFGTLKILEGYYLSGITYFAFGYLAFASLLSIIVRGQILLVLICIILAFFLQVLNGLKNPKFWLIFFALGLLLIYGITISELPGRIFDLMAKKTENAGLLNSRDNELFAVFFNATSSIGALLQGEGWGGAVVTFGMPFRFTHSLPTYLILKGGLLGFGFGFMYCWLIVSAMVRYFIKSIRSNTICPKRSLDIAFSFAVANNLFLNLLLEPGYKMFSFGFVITMLWLAALEERKQPIINAG